ncbi:MFS general substrate transporter [Suillus hirtellus]|nr:MFS general substrate transporter [Suillus hirtellus]
MDSPQSQVTDSHPELITLPDCCWYPSNILPVAPSFLSHDAHHGHSLGANIVVETRLLTESSSKTGATFKKTITQLSHPGLDDHENAFSPESLARTPSTATHVDVFPTDAWSRKNSFEKEAEVSTPSLEFEHVTQRLLTAYFIYFVCGWGDGGHVVLPAFEEDFGLSYTMCSLLFTGSTVGSVIGTILLEQIVNFLGQFYLSLDQHTYFPAVPFFDRLFTKNVSAALPCSVGYSPAKARFCSLVLGGLLHPLFFVVMGTARNYPALFLAYAIAAFARSFWTGEHLNFYVVSTPKKPLGVLLGCWCIGSFSAPLVCQTLMAKGIPWKHFYLGSLVISAVALSLIIFSFRPTRNEFLADCKVALNAMKIRPSANSPGTDTTIQLSHAEKVRDSSTRCVDTQSPPNTLFLAFSMPYQWAFSLFAFIYSGSETTFQGFIVTYLLTNRGSSPNTVGYVSSGFWGGMAAGRILWGYYCTGLTFTQRKRIIHACTSVTPFMTLKSVSFLMTILIWFVDSTIENALSSAVVGLMYGPIFPGTLGLCNDILPRDVHMVSMAILTAVASAGSAVLPFITGIISNKDGMRVFCYVTVSQNVAMFVLWLFFPSSPPVRVSYSV